MISNNSVEKKNLSVFLKIYKNAYSIVLPITVLIAVFSGILSIFTSAEGSNARQTATILFIIFGVISLTQIVFDQIFEHLKVTGL